MKLHFFGVGLHGWLDTKGLHFEDDDTGTDMALGVQVGDRMVLGALLDSGVRDIMEGR